MRHMRFSHLLRVAICGYLLYIANTFHSKEPMSVTTEPNKIDNNYYQIVCASDGLWIRTGDYRA